MSDTEIDLDEDWIDLEQPKSPGVIRPEVTLMMTVRPGRYAPKSGVPRVRATIWLRRDAAAWIAANGPRFKAQIGGPNCNFVRLVPDARQGRFEASELKGVQRLALGVVNVWPNEIRRDVEARWTVTPAGLVLTLPADFAQAGQGETPALAGPAPAVDKRSSPPPAAFPIVTKANGLERIAGEADRRSRRVLAMTGEPPAGRSALDQRRAARDD